MHIEMLEKWPGAGVDKGVKVDLEAEADSAETILAGLWNYDVITRKRQVELFFILCRFECHL